MTISSSPFPSALGTSRPPLRINPVVVIGLGAFGGATLRLLTDRLRPTHPALVKEMGWLWLSASGWQVGSFSVPGGDPSSESTAPVGIDPEPLSQAFDRATSQATMVALLRAGYEVSTTLDTFVVARADDPLARGTLWPLLDLIRSQPPTRGNRVTLILACDSRRFAGPSAPALAQLFEELAERLIADRANPGPGGTAWCYLCDTLDTDSRLLNGGGSTKEVVQSQVELIGGFLALLIGSGLRRDLTYARTAIPQLAHDTSAPADAALVSSFSWGAYVLPIDQIAALARDRLALRLHEAAFPLKASETDREIARNARERLFATTDLSPQGLRERLLRGPDGAPVQFDTPAPDLGGLEPEATLQALDQWRTGLEARWADENSSPPARIARNADEMLAELTEAVQSEVQRLLKDAPRGLHQGLAFLDELPQVIEDARVQTVADDSYYLKRAVPSVENRFRELGELITEKRGRVRRDSILVSLVFGLAVILTVSLGAGIWSYVLASWPIGLTAIWLRHIWRRRRGLRKGQSRFIAAVQRKYRAMYEREIRAERRGLFDAFLELVRRERGSLLAWQNTIATAKVALEEANRRSAIARPAYGERFLCDATDYPAPIEAFDEAQITAIATHHLDRAARPRWNEGDAEAIAHWLRQGAAHALAGWREAISVASWSEPDPPRAISELAATIQPQWRLAREEQHLVEVNLVGLPDKEILHLLHLDGFEQILIGSTYDPSRVSYAPTYHRLRLKTLAATQALWKPPVKPERLPSRDAVHRTYIWRFGPAGEAEEHRINLILSWPRYQAFRAEPRQPRGQWGHLVTADTPELDALATAFRRLHRQRDWSGLEQARNVLAFTQQCITYKSDPPASEQPRYPLETLIDGAGDREDKVILATAVLARLGWNVALLYYAHHCALGVPVTEDLPGAFVEDPQSGTKYLYGEITAEGWSLGEVPEKGREVPPDGIEVMRM